MSPLVTATSVALLTKSRAYQDLCYLVEKYAPASQTTSKNTQNVEPSTKTQRKESISVDETPVPPSETLPLGTTTVTEKPSQPATFTDHKDPQEDTLHIKSQDLEGAPAETTETSSIVGEAKENDWAATPEKSFIEPELATSNGPGLEDTILPNLEMLSVDPFVAVSSRQVVPEMISNR